MRSPPKLTVRVCDSLSCALAGAADLLDRLPALLGPDVRVVPAPCVGRCHAAPVAVVGQNPVDAATTATVQAAVSAGAVEARRRAVRRRMRNIAPPAATRPRANAPPAGATSRRC